MTDPLKVCDTRPRMNVKHALYTIGKEKCVTAKGTVRVMTTWRRVHESYIYLQRKGLVISMPDGVVHLTDRGRANVPDKLCHRTKRRAIEVLSEYERFVLVAKHLKPSNGVTMNKPISRYVADMLIDEGVLKYDERGYLYLDVPEKTVTLTFRIFSGEVEAVRNAVYGVTGNDQHRHHK